MSASMRSSGLPIMSVLPRMADSAIPGASLSAMACIASCAGHTGVEMEALTAVSAAALTVYDMCKAVQKDILISDIHLLEKTGGVHGDYSYAGK